MHLRNIATAVAASLFLAACGKDATGPGQDLLAYVPADSPYVMASLEPFDGELRQAWVKAYGGPAMIDLYRSMLTEAMASAKDDQERQVMQMVNSILDELAPLLDPEQPTPLGMAEDAELALYGYGLLPVMRMRLADPAEFEKVVARLEQSSGKAMTTDEVGGHKVRRQEIDEVVVYVATIADQAVFALLPLSQDQALREQVLGLTLPERSMLDSGTLSQVAKQYGLQGNAGVAVVDTAALVGAMINPSRPGDKALMALGEDGDEPEALDPVCQSEVAALGAAIPRLVMGGTRMDAGGMDALSVLEMAPDLAKRWVEVSAAQPGANAPKDAWAWFGLGIDPVKTGTALRAMADEVAADPFSCEQLTDLNQAMAEMKESLNPMAIGMAANFHGVFASFDNIVLDEERNPVSGEGVVAISSPAPAALWALASGQMEELSALQIGVDKGVVEVPGELFPLPFPAKALMTDKSLALAVGDIDDERIRAIAEVDPDAERPILRYGVTGRFYSEFYGEVMLDMMTAEALAESDEEAEAKNMTREQRLKLAKDMAELMRKTGEAIEYLDVRIVMSEAGMEIRQEMRLKQ